MTESERILLQAIEKSLWNRNISLPADTDWNEVLKEADTQAVLGIIFSIAPNDIQQKWASKAYAGRAHYIRILHYQEQLVQLMAKKGIPMAIIKGCAASIYYPVPSKRSMGDIDFIVPKNRFNEANQILRENGYIFASEHSEKRHTSYVKDSISVELHYHFSYEDIDVESYIEEGLHHLEIKTIDGFSFPVLPKHANGLVLLAHMLHHFKTAVGLRQMVDWMMFVNNVLDDNFWEEKFKQCADQTGLTQAACVATRLCQEYLGLSDKITWCKTADPDLCQELLGYLLSSGNFGRKSKADMAIEVTSTKLQREGVFTHLQKKGEENWNAYHKHRWLKPFAWIHQAFLYLWKAILAKRKGAKISTSISQGQKRKKLYNKLTDKQTDK